jgi:hypothetical protein
MKEAIVENDQDHGRNRPGISICHSGPGISRGIKRRLNLMIQTGVVCLCLWGCGNVPETPGTEAGTPNAPGAADQSMANSVPWNSLAELKTYMTPDRTKLAIAGGAVLLVTFLVGVAVGKSRKRASPSQEPSHG